MHREFANIIHQDIKAWWESKCGLLLLDPHGSLYDSITEWLVYHQFDLVRGHANQCIYALDRQTVTLLTEPTGAGTVDWKKPGTLKHYSHDVEPVIVANTLDGGSWVKMFFIGRTPSKSLLAAPGVNLTKYYSVRPSWW